MLENTYDQLDKLSLQQDDLFRQALRCLESELYRAAHVMAWAAFMDFLEEKMASDGLVKLGTIRPKWNIRGLVELREHVPEQQLVEACQGLGLTSKTVTKALLGLLNKRNECAHPSEYYPGLNETLGYVTELLQRIEAIRKRSI